jgi:crotonobetainyl-CoA:carnitine CoA-transferase CaiB-like acyl-CoA transferase
MGPLAGYRVLELGSTIAGPVCGRLLADFGAEVIKVEPREGDRLRASGKLYKGKSLNAATLLRNKKLISVDLRTPEGQALIRKVVTKCDAVVENFRPGGLEKWGLGYEDLKRVRPSIVMVRISGFGQTGPYSSKPGYGVICEAASGLRHLTGDPDRPPARVAMPLTDYITGLYAAFGAVMALLHALRTGEGQYVDAALAECALSFTETHVPAYEKLGVVANRMGSGLADSVPNNLYPTRDDKYVHIQASQDAVFRRLATAMGNLELALDDRFKSARERQKNQEALEAIITAWTRSQPMHEIRSALDAADVPAMGVNTVADVFADVQFKAREMLLAVPDEDLGTVTVVGPVPKLSATPGTVTVTGGRVGRDTRDVLTELGITPAELERMHAQGIVYCDGQD